MLRLEDYMELRRRVTVLESEFELLHSLVNAHRRNVDMHLSVSRETETDDGQQTIKFPVLTEAERREAQARLGSNFHGGDRTLDSGSV